MAIISIPNNKPVEYHDLETHVVLSRERYQVLESKIATVEGKVNDIVTQSRARNKLILGGIVTVVAGIIISIAGKLISWGGIS